MPVVWRRKCSGAGMIQAPGLRIKSPLRHRANRFAAGACKSRCACIVWLVRHDATPVLERLRGMKTPILLYSASTWLAYSVAERFYGVHYAWCTAFYDGITAPRHFNIPPTSSPAEIYLNLEEETRRGDLHSDAIRRNVTGIMTGAEAKLQTGAITDAQYQEIEVIVEKAQIPDFRPVLYVIPFDRLEGRVPEVPVTQRAHPLSLEYRVDGMRRGCFDVLEIRR